MTKGEKKAKKRSDFYPILLNVTISLELLSSPNTQNNFFRFVFRLFFAFFILIFSCVDPRTKSKGTKNVSKRYKKWTLK